MNTETTKPEPFRIILMINPDTGDAMRVETKVLFEALKADGWRPIVLKGAK